MDRKNEGHSKNFGKVKKNYEDGAWSIDRVKNAIGRWITEAEFAEITEKTGGDTDGK